MKGGGGGGDTLRRVVDVDFCAGSELELNFVFFNLFDFRLVLKNFFLVMHFLIWINILVEDRETE